MHVCSFISALPKAGPRHTSPPKPTVPGSPFHLQLAVRFFAPSPHPRGCMRLSAGFKIWYDVCSAKGRSMVSISTKHHPPRFAWDWGQVWKCDTMFVHGVIAFLRGGTPCPSSAVSLLVLSSTWSYTQAVAQEFEAGGSRKKPGGSIIFLRAERAKIFF